LHKDLFGQLASNGQGLAQWWQSVIRLPEPLLHKVNGDENILSPGFIHPVRTTDDKRDHQYILVRKHSRNPMLYAVTFSIKFGI